MNLYRRPNKILLLFIGLLSTSAGWAQSGYYWSNTLLNQQIEKHLAADSQIDFMSVKPYAVKDIRSWLDSQNDTAAVFGSMGTSFWAMPDTKAWKINALPIFDFDLGYTNRAKGTYTTAAGMAANVQYGTKWSLYADILVGENRLPRYLSEFTDSSGIILSRGKNHATEGNPAFVIPTARLNFAPSDYFQFDLGYGRHFFGQGYRSLCLSDVAFNYPYFKITTDVWKFKYVNVFSLLRGTDGVNFRPKDFKSKYTTTHYLNWAISPKWNLGVFETLVWQGRDSLSNRGFDPNYLNPFIFYRPVEYSVGSPDNALIGIDLSYKLKPAVVLYGQFVIDEFLLDEFRNRTGWWANKWALQLGAKFFDFAKVEDLYLQAEFNVVRPFTYTHGSVLQNFGHYNQPLAHPRGANFYEGLVRAYYQTGKWYGETLAIYSPYGVDPDTLNLGSDIFKSYVNPSLNYGNKITQGIKSHFYYQSFKLGYVLNPAMNLRISASYTYRYNHIEKQLIQKEHMLGIELSTLIFKHNHAL